MNKASLRKMAGLSGPVKSSQSLFKPGPDVRLTTERLKTLASYCVESESVQSFGLKDENNVKTACIEIAQAGIPVDMEYFMGIYYFNFKDKKAHDRALKSITKKIDTSKEDELGKKETA